MIALGYLKMWRFPAWKREQRCQDAAELFPEWSLFWIPQASPRNSRRLKRSTGSLQLKWAAAMTSQHCWISFKSAKQGKLTKPNVLYCIRYPCNHRGAVLQNAVYFSVSGCTATLHFNGYELLVTKTFYLYKKQPGDQLYENVIPTKSPQYNQRGPWESIFIDDVLCCCLTNSNSLKYCSLCDIRVYRSVQE